MALTHPLYTFYERRLTAALEGQTLPCHVGVILDGNRRWARSFGEPTATGYRRGADKIATFLGWCDELGIQIATIWMLSTDNLARPKDELAELLVIIEAAVRALAAQDRWRIRVVGQLDLLPERIAVALREAEAATEHITTGVHVNVAIGYGGRHEIADAVRAVLMERAAAGATLAEVAETIDVDDIASHLYTKGQPDPELVIRTSGEQRLGGFLMWQSAHSEFYFCEAYWPDFRRVDFLRALRDFSQRERRLGR